ncbi:TauD/TfdA family dioxygenase [Verminephrobacter aporrectodeae]|uniref:TauD/TfdA-like domain-containing protein n=2 Tax=Verminephrobacter TaxID=364316 RepID=A0ABT3KXZ9_9BURK|nr:TauD/TfdA family dioxygenase [Verminephrobacter aporrectodeae]MCW5256426.1 hypothetical protein [Verminephrobacter aporrectodeae subsp. tuberculatae]MCW5323211.1 hypothetical protein [Verminephrobacter aporrectodeae subsp. tuberculatae]MCW8175084.1 hypothetical protein [Verminephrobacter aporrectodeae subsp. tuberculatae]MCW8197833.1 hypothetical protein [Verminephrobacter aporrectodeae subsp. tuberculatae]MCW8202386.1 hypothetical protein [Verminephrobacter aporrectodeae subsp. tuberculata
MKMNLGNKIDIPVWQASEGISELRAAYRKHGLVMLRNIRSKLEFLNSLSEMGGVYHHPHAEASGLTHVQVVGSSSDHAHAADRNELGLTGMALTPHSDRSSMTLPPEFLAFWIESQSCIGGASTFVDGHRLIEEMSAHEPEAVQVLTRPKSVVFKSEEGLKESSVISLEGDEFLMRFRFDRMVYLSPDVAAVMPKFNALVRQLTMMINLTSGDGYLVNNHRWLHGRTHFAGARSAYRLLMKRPHLSPI